MHSLREIQKGSSKQIKPSLRDKEERVQDVTHSVSSCYWSTIHKYISTLTMEVQNDPA